MAIDILTWIFAGGFAACAITVVYLIIAYIYPMFTSPGKYFMRAKKEKKPIVILDTGKYFRFVVGDDKIGEEKNQVIRKGTDVVKIPNVGGLKYAEGNVLMGIGEDFRSMITNVAIMDLMGELNRKGWDADLINSLLKDLISNLKIDLGYVDGIENLREQLEEDTAQINARYDAAIEREKAPVNPPVPKATGDPGLTPKEKEEDNGEGPGETDLEED